MKKIFLSVITLFSATVMISAQSDTTLKEYTGRYVFPEGTVVPDVTVSLQGDQLSMGSSAGTSQLSKLGVDSFSVVEFQGTAVFRRNGNKKVNAVHIEAAGYVLDGTKEETGWLFKVYRKPVEMIVPE